MLSSFEKKERYEKLYNGVIQEFKQSYEVLIREYATVGEKFLPRDKNSRFSTEKLKYHKWLKDILLNFGWVFVSEYCKEETKTSYSTKSSLRRTEGKSFNVYSQGKLVGTAREKDSYTTENVRVKNETHIFYPYQKFIRLINLNKNEKLDYYQNLVFKELLGFSDRVDFKPTRADYRYMNNIINDILNEAKTNGVLFDKNMVIKETKIVDKKLEKLTKKCEKRNPDPIFSSLQKKYRWKACYHEALNCCKEIDTVFKSKI